MLRKPLHHKLVKKWKTYKLFKIGTDMFMTHKDKFTFCKFLIFKKKLFLFKIQILFHDTYYIFSIRKSGCLTEYTSDVTESRLT